MPTLVVAHSFTQSERSLHQRVVFDRTSRKQDITIAALSQVVADLLTGPGRRPNEGEALMEWMRDNENAWRA